MRARHRLRLALNLVNGSTLCGLAVARLGRARLARCQGGLLAGTGYGLPVPVRSRLHPRQRDHHPAALD